MRVRSQTGANMADVRAAWKKKKAQRDLDRADPMEEEMKKLAIKKKEEEEVSTHTHPLPCPNTKPTCVSIFAPHAYGSWKCTDSPCIASICLQEAKRKKKESQERLKAKAAFLNTK